MPDVSRLAQLRARLDLPLTRHATGLLEGRHPSLLQGHGDDFDDLSLYSPGDDVSDIDWKSSARAGVPVIKRFVSQRNVTVVVAVDTGRSMAATAASEQPKAEVALRAVGLVAHLARDRGDRVALVAADAGRVTRLPARGGTGHLEVLLRQVERAFDLAAPVSDLDRLLRLAAASVTRRSLVVLVTDDAHPGPEHEASLRRVRIQHDIMVLSVADADPLAVPTDGGAGGAGRASRDVVDGWVVPGLLRGREDLQAALARHRAEQHEARAAMLRRLQVTDLLVRGTEDLVPALVEAARRRRARR